MESTMSEFLFPFLPMRSSFNLLLTFENEAVAQFVAKIKPESSRLLVQFHLILIKTGSVHCTI